MKNKIYQGDCLEVLKTFPDESINCVITSPPYFNLRDYQCKGQIGLESTYQEYLKKLIDIFNEIKRVLKKDGTCFVNIADSFCGNKVGNTSEKWDKINNNNFKKQKAKDILEKSLMAIPARFQIAMIDNGWICRNDLIWIKRNAMPESVQDRWKKAHEHIFFFTKSKKYHFDLDAIRTPHKEVLIKRAEYEQGRNALEQNPSSMGEKYNRDKKNKDGTEKYLSMPARFVKLNPKGACPPDFLDVNTNCKQDDTTEHYATYPQDLIIPLIKAGCPVGGIVLDPFLGSGTTAVVARKLDRDYVGIELNQNYIKIAEQRLCQQKLL